MLYGFKPLHWRVQKTEARHQRHGSEVGVMQQPKIRVACFGNQNGPGGH